MKELEVGDLVLVTHSFLGSEPGIKGFVYETYQDFDDSTQKGVSIILESGRDLGGFSREEQFLYLEFVESTGLMYNFENVIQLDKDFKSGFFNNCFRDKDGK